MENKSKYLFIGNIGPSTDFTSNTITAISSGTNYFTRIVYELEKTEKIYIDGVIFSKDKKKDYVKNNYFLSFFTTKSSIKSSLERKHLILKNFKKMNLPQDGIPLTILVEGLYRPELSAALKIKKKNKNVVVIVIVPDLPTASYSVEAQSNIIFRYLKKIDEKAILNYSKKVDGYIFFTKTMEDRLPRKPNVVIEAIAPTEIQFGKNRIYPDKKTVLYAGSIEDRYSVCDFAKEFAKTADDNSLLLIAGAGNFEPIKKINSPNVQYLGLVSNEEAQILMSSVDVCVNPRLPFEEYTKYSFPSKTMDYLANCGIVACHKLFGIPNEYGEILNYPEEPSTSSLVKMVNKLLGMTLPQIEIAKNKVRQFLQNKGPKFAVEKIKNLEKQIRC